MCEDSDFAEFDFSEYPYVKMRMISSSPTQEQFDFFVEQFIKLFCEDKFYIIFDCSQITGLPLKYLHQIAKLIGQLKTLSEKHLIGTGVIITRKSVRMCINMIFNIKSPQRPTKCFETESDAIQWLSDLTITSKASDYTDDI